MAYPSQPMAANAAGSPSKAAPATPKAPDLASAAAAVEDGEYELQSIAESPPPTMASYAQAAPPPLAAAAAATPAPRKGSSRPGRESSSRLPIAMDSSTVKIIVGVLVAILLALVAKMLISGWYTVKGVQTVAGLDAAASKLKDGTHYIVTKEHPDGRLLVVWLRAPQSLLRRDEGMTLPHTTAARFLPDGFKLVGESRTAVARTILVEQHDEHDFFIDGSVMSVGRDIGDPITQVGEFERHTEQGQSWWTGDVTLSTPHLGDVQASVGGFGGISVTAPSDTVIWRGGKSMNLSAHSYDRGTWTFGVVFSRIDVEDGKMTLMAGDTAITTIKTSSVPAPPPDPDADAEGDVGATD